MGKEDGILDIVSQWCIASDERIVGFVLEDLVDGPNAIRPLRVPEAGVMIEKAWMGQK